MIPYVHMVPSDHVLNSLLNMREIFILKLLLTSQSVCIFS